MARSKVALDALLLDDEQFDLLTENEAAEYLQLMEQVIGEQWELTPKQMLAVALWSKVDWLLWGGSAGAGKSEMACWHANQLANRIDGHASLLLRQSIPELRRSLILRLIARVKQFNIPAHYRKVDGQPAFHYKNGSIIECGFLATDEHLGRYLSSEYDEIIVDEASLMTPDQITQIAARLRTTKEKASRGARPHLGLFTNPGGRAHAWMYDLLVVPTGYGDRVVVYNVENGLGKAFIVRTYDAPVPIRGASLRQIEDVLIPWAEALEVECDPRSELAVAFVPALATDNPHIDPAYLKYLNALPERRRRQLRDGDWDVFEGQYFESFDRNVHVVPWFEIPEGWQRARGIDWGQAAPFCCLWGAWDNDGNCYIYREAYQAGMTPDQQAKLINELSVTPDGKKEKYRATVADPSVFSDKRGAGRSIAQMWSDAGLSSSRAKNERIAGWQNVRQYLDAPKLFILDGVCPNLVRTLPLMQYDRVKSEDLDTDLEDHAVDAARYLLMTRPLKLSQRSKAPEGVGANERFARMIYRLDKRKGRRWN